MKNLQVDTLKIQGTGSFTVSIDVTSTGLMTGSEIIQTYLSEDNATVSRPPRVLQGFDKVLLNPGEKKKNHHYFRSIGVRILFRGSSCVCGRTGHIYNPCVEFFPKSPLKREDKICAMN